MNHAFYLRLANVARKLDLEIDEKELYTSRFGYPPSETLRQTTEKLRGTVFFRATGRLKVPMANPTVTRYILGKLYLGAFRLITSSMPPKDLPLCLPAPAVTHIAFVDLNRKVGVSETSLYSGYRQFLRDLGSFEVERIKECPVCGAIFEGRKNSVYCRKSCRQEGWRRRNPKDYSAAQKQRDAHRKVKRRQNRLQREREQADKIPDQILVRSTRRPRLPGARNRGKSTQ
jgi:hypothetical protein